MRDIRTAIGQHLLEKRAKSSYVAIEVFEGGPQLFVVEENVAVLREALPEEIGKFSPQPGAWSGQAG